MKLLNLNDLKSLQSRKDLHLRFKIQVEGMNEAVVGCGDQSMKQLFATHPELEDGLLIGRSNIFSCQ